MASSSSSAVSRASPNRKTSKTTTMTCAPPPLVTGHALQQGPFCEKLSMPLLLSSSPPPADGVVMLEASPTTHLVLHDRLRRQLQQEDERGQDRAAGWLKEWLKARAVVGSDTEASSSGMEVLLSCLPDVGQLLELLQPPTSWGPGGAAGRRLQALGRVAAKTHQWLMQHSAAGWVVVDRRDWSMRAAVQLTRQKAPAAVADTKRREEDKALSSCLAKAFQQDPDVHITQAPCSQGAEGGACGLPWSGEGAKPGLLVVGPLGLVDSEAIAQALDQLLLLGVTSAALEPVAEGWQQQQPPVVQVQTFCIVRSWEGVVSQQWQEASSRAVGGVLTGLLAVQRLAQDTRDQALQLQQARETLAKLEAAERCQRALEEESAAATARGTVEREAARQQRARQEQQAEEEAQQARREGAAGRQRAEQRLAQLTAELASEQGDQSHAIHAAADRAKEPLKQHVRTTRAAIAWAQDRIQHEQHKAQAADERFRALQHTLERVTAELEHHKTSHATAASVAVQHKAVPGNHQHQKKKN